MPFLGPLYSPNPKLVIKIFQEKKAIKCINIRILYYSDVRTVRTLRTKQSREMCILLQVVSEEDAHVFSK